MRQQVFDRNWAVWMADTVMERFPVMRNKWSYDQSVASKGLEMVFEVTGDEQYADYIKRNMDRFVEEDGSIPLYNREEFNLDHISNGKILLFLWRMTGEDKYKKAAALVRSQLDRHPRTSEGGFWHKQVYRHQMWLDGLYMGQPFYAEYTRLFGETGAARDAAWDDIVRQFRLIDTHLKDPVTHLLYHGWDESRTQPWADPETGRSAHFWGRAMGWYSCALVDTLDHLERPVDREILIGMVQDLAAAVVSVQSQRTGVWYQVLDREDSFGNYPEASCSCMFTYFLLKAVRKGYIDPSYRAAGQKAFRSIVREFIEVGPDSLLNLHGTVYVSGLGGDTVRDGSYEYYVSEPRQLNHMHGLGAFMMAAAEMERLKEAPRG